MASFQEISRTVADGYRSIDAVTLEYVTTVAAILKHSHKELMEMRCLGRFAARYSSSAPSNPDKARHFSSSFRKCLI